ncbi:hypothetical protein [Merismopedia glauca]|uniref:Uncharacterized protein n=1 Tax=Merismopedia glauca CCAP 1448/3 TaxID=1296344 RepID=A0A2T1BX95_9CYAN|nr:hypothetical protein [Merismopedia glauca]PSB00630.1 hypothetical protein C7B64_22540 [Merismopedia glauca CCAP 1448/3]
MVFKINFNHQTQEEKFQYRPGIKVELKSRPGVVDTIALYDPMMVPPITLEKDPQPRYPEELRIVTKKAGSVEWLKPLYSHQVG